MTIPTPAIGPDRPGSTGRSGPLQGLRVLDVGNMFAAPFAAALLGDMGADVVKIELPGRGDPLRALEPLDGDQPLVWAALARNKRSVTLDLHRPEGQEVFCRLVARHDVLLENFRPGTLDKWGLTLDRLRDANSRIVVVRISGFGQTGPYAPRAGFGTPATAFSGYAYSTGFADRPPVLPPIALVDYLAGLFAAFGAVVALYHRDALGGPAQEVDVALYESMLRLLDGMVVGYDRHGTVQERTGNDIGASVPVGMFASRDGAWMVLSTSTDRTFGRLAEVMGRAEMTSDPRYCSNHARVAHRDEVNAAVGDWFSRHDAAEIQRACDAAGVPVSRVNSMADIFADPHVRARDMLVRIDHPTLGEIRLPGIVPRMSPTPGTVRWTGPALGRHSDDVYLEAGLSRRAIDELRRDGVI